MMDAAVQVSPDDLTAFLKATFEAAAKHDWRVFAALLLVGVVWLARKYAMKLPGAVGSFFQGDRGGAVLALVLGVLGAVGHMLTAGAGFSLQTVTDGLVMAVTAAGGWTVFKHLLGQGNAQVAAKAPAADAPEANGGAGGPA